jgi:hypothetical protein
MAGRHRAGSRPSPAIDLLNAGTATVKHVADDHRGGWARTGRRRAGVVDCFGTPVYLNRSQPTVVSHAGLEADGPSVVSIECSADEIRPFAPFLGQQAPAVTATPDPKEDRANVAARA